MPQWSFRSFAVLHDGWACSLLRQIERFAPSCRKRQTGVETLACRAVTAVRLVKGCGARHALREAMAPIGDEDIIEASVDGYEMSTTRPNPAFERTRRHMASSSEGPWRRAGWLRRWARFSPSSMSKWIVATASFERAGAESTIPDG